MNGGVASSCRTGCKPSSHLPCRYRCWPAWVRSRISALSNSAAAPKTWSKKRDAELDSSVSIFWLVKPDTWGPECPAQDETIEFPFQNYPLFERPAATGEVAWIAALLDSQSRQTFRKPAGVRGIQSSQKPSSGPREVSSRPGRFAARFETSALATITNPLCSSACLR